MREKFIRTMVPVLVSILASIGIGTTESGLIATVILPALVGLVYYIAVRVIEARWPGFGVLLGIPKTPSYTHDDVLSALLRTIVPLMVAGAVRFGLESYGLDEQTVVNVTTMAVTAGYYALFGWLETHWPKFGAFLGFADAPTYK